MMNEVINLMLFRGANNKYWKSIDRLIGCWLAELLDARLPVESAYEHATISMQARSLMVVSSPPSFMMIHDLWYRYYRTRD